MKKQSRKIVKQQVRQVAQRSRRQITRYVPRRPYFASDDVVVGRNVIFGRNVVFNSDRVRIGDGVIFDDDIRIDSTSFEIGDFGTIYSDCFFPGQGAVQIGHNCWIGRGAIVDCMGGTTIGNNVCIGVHSQLWSHMIFGDVLYGCRFHNTSELIVGDDVWFSSGCLVSPIIAGDRSLAMLGSVVTKDMEADRVYGGVPAVDITDKTGPQFAPRPFSERVGMLEERLEEFGRARGIDWRSHIRIVIDAAELAAGPEDVITLNVADRTYTKRRTRLENDLLRYLLPDAKFVPAPPLAG